MRLCYLLLLSSSAFAGITPRSAVASDSANDNPANGHDFGELRNSVPIRRSLSAHKLTGTDERMNLESMPEIVQQLESIVQRELSPKLKRLHDLEAIPRESPDEDFGLAALFNEEHVEDVEELMTMMRSIERPLTPAEEKEKHVRDVLDEIVSAKTEEEKSSAETKLDALISEWETTNKQLSDVIPLLNGIQDVEFFLFGITKLLKSFSKGPNAETDSVSEALFVHCGEEADRFFHTVEDAHEFNVHDVYDAHENNVRVVFDEEAISKSRAWLLKKVPDFKVEDFWKSEDVVAAKTSDERS